MSRDLEARAGLTRLEMAALVENDEEAERQWLAAQGVEQAPRGLRNVPLDGFMTAQALCAEFVVYPWIPRRLASMLGAHGGAGKSMLILVMLAHAACGRAWAGLDIECCRCLYVSLEDPGSLVRYRLRRICEAYSLDSEMVATNLRIVCASDGDSSLATEINDNGVRRLFRTARWEDLEALAIAVDWIVIDNASDAYDGNENERRQVRAFMRWLTELATKQDAALTLLVHVDKRSATQGAAGNSYSGSTAWHNSVRSRLALSANTDGTVQLAQEKSNLAKAAEPITLRWSDHGVLMPASEGLAPDADTIRLQREDCEGALLALQSAVKVGVFVGAATSGTSTSWHALEPLPDLPAAFKGKDKKAGKARLHSALLRLSIDGLIERQRCQTSSRNYREKWVLTKAGEDVADALADRRRRSSPTTPPRTHERGAFVVSTESEPLTKHSRSHEGLGASAYRATKDGDL